MVWRVPSQYESENKHNRIMYCLKTFFHQNIAHLFTQVPVYPSWSLRSLVSSITLSTSFATFTLVKMKQLRVSRKRIHMDA